MKYRSGSTFIVCALLLCMSMALAQEAEQDIGAENIRIRAGRMNDVHFPHHRHQVALGDCAVCHDLFPKKADSIHALKNQGKLKKKQVMNKHCIACHRKMKSADRKTGPLSCGRCHHT